MERLYPELIYYCPKNNKWFDDPETYCLDPPKCEHYHGTKKDEWGPMVSFDVILCDYDPSTAPIKEGEEEECA